MLARALEVAARGGRARRAEAAALLEELATLYDQHLGRPAEALEARLRGADAGAALGRAARRGARAGAPAPGRSSVSSTRCHGLAEESYEPDRALELLLSLGRALERDAGDERRAVKAYQDAEILLVARADTERVREVWRALDDIYARLGDTEAEHALLARWVGDAAHADDTPPGRRSPLSPRCAAPAQPPTQAEGLGLLDRALAANPNPERAESVLREALKNAPGSACDPRPGALRRERGRDRALPTASVMAWG